MHFSAAASHLTAMARRISWRFALGGLATAALIGATTYFALDSRQRDRAFRQWVVARPVSMTVDCARTGRYSAPFKQTCQVAHGEAICLELPPSLPAKDAAEALDRAEATISIVSGDGIEVVSQPLEATV